ncbi:MAG: response regulator [Chloroflexi bacterium]|nr:response regulator [Chloroflexota bacterium]
MPPTSGTPCHILVVEDDPAIMMMIQLLLEMRGYSSTAVADGEAAINYLREADALPSLILLDLQMPGMDGKGFLAIRQATPEWQAIPVILLSATQEITAVQLQLDVQASIRKPFDPESMLNLVERFCS